MACTAPHRIGILKQKFGFAGWVVGWVVDWLAGWWLHVIERVASEFVMQLMQKNLSCIQYAAKIEW